MALATKNKKKSSEIDSVPIEAIIPAWGVACGMRQCARINVIPKAAHEQSSTIFYDPPN